jgi:hypothetical protein
MSAIATRTTAAVAMRSARVFLVIFDLLGQTRT